MPIAADDPSRPILLDQDPSPDSDGPADVDGSGEMLARIMEAPPSAGTAGLMELRHHWKTLFATGRRALLRTARKLVGERSP